MKMKTNDTTKQIGKILNEKRLARNISVDLINKDTRIPKSYIEAIEEGDVSRFTAEVYYTGSLRRYALYLGLNANELIDMYQNSKISLNEKVIETKSVKREKINFFRVFVAISVIIIISLAVLYVLLDNRPMQKQTLSERKPVIVKEQAAPVIKRVKKNVLELEVTPISSTWIRVVSDGKLVFERVLNTGDKRNWTAKENILLRVGYYPGISATLNGELLNLSQGSKEYVSEINISKESLRNKTDVKKETSKDIISEIKD